MFCTTETYTYTDYVPVYLSQAEIDAVKSEAPRALEQPGKLYLHNDLILINDFEKGIHVLDNSDKTKPVNLGFIAIPGNHDLLVKEAAGRLVLYADNYRNLLALDITDVSNVKVLKRLRGVFDSFYEQPDQDGKIFVGYEEKLVTVSYRNCPNIYPGPLVDMPVAPPAPDSGGGEGASQGGSLARFAALDDYLFTIDGNAIQTFRLETLDNPTLFNRVPVTFGIETLFPYRGESGDQLYVGGNAGLYIMDASNPANIKEQGRIDHVQSCDPVVVQEELAYVTLQGSCFNQANRLEIISVANPAQPELLSDYALQEPFGLGIDGDTLFVCDGEAGLKVYTNAREPEGLELFKQFADIKARDIIPYAGTAIVIAENGFFQYDYSNIASGEMTLLSKILVTDGN